TRAIGAITAAALGLRYHTRDSQALHNRYVRAGLDRSQQVLGVWQDGVLAGIALRHAASVPLNFSFLCHRTEIIIHPDASNRADLVRDLARAAIRAASQGRQPVPPYTLLIDEIDVAAAVQGGFQSTGTHYCRGIWKREGTAGWPSIIRGLN